MLLLFVLILLAIALVVWIVRALGPVAGLIVVAVVVVCLVLLTSQGAIHL